MALISRLVALSVKLKGAELLENLQCIDVTLGRHRVLIDRAFAIYVGMREASICGQEGPKGILLGGSAWFLRISYAR